MQALREAIARRGEVFPGNILKVDSFLNHQIDIELMEEIGQAFYRIYKATNVTKILTIETSGIAVAYATARAFGVPMVFAKKTGSINIGADVYSADVYSYTRQQELRIRVSRRYLPPHERVLIIDDFLAHGSALSGLAALAGQAGATVVGAGIVIEKAFQGGGAKLRATGLRIESLASIRALAPQIEFNEDA